MSEPKKGLRSRLARYGRRQEQLKIMPGVCCVVADSRAEAEDAHAVFEDLIQPEVGLMMLNSTVGLDLSGYPLDMRLESLPDTDGHKGRQKLMLDMGVREKLTVASSPSGRRARADTGWCLGRPGTWRMRWRSGSSRARSTGST